jgi:hypothetical protein
VTPYLAGAELFLNVEQIIPTPESAEFMIGMAAKEAEEKAVGNEVKKRFRLRLGFWEQLLDVLKGSTCNLFDNISPGKDHWLGAGSGLAGVSYNLIFGKKEVRVELYFSRANGVENTFVFERLQEQKDEIEKVFGENMDWQPLAGKKACRICIAKPFDGYDDQNWEAMINWFNEYVPKLEAAFKGPIEQVSKQLKAHSFESAVTNQLP